MFSSSKFPSNTAGYEPLFKPPCNNDNMNSKHQLNVTEELKAIDSKSIKVQSHTQSHTQSHAQSPDISTITNWYI